MSEASNTVERVVRLDDPVTQEAFGALVGISQQAVSDLVARRVIITSEPVGVWLMAYCAHLRQVAAGRDLDGTLARERASLSRVQREGQEIKNAVAREEYAPVGLLGDVLAFASAAVVDRLDALPATLRKACPDLPVEARDAISKTLASARNEWIKSTAELVVERLDQLADDADESDPERDLLEETPST